ncbi:hypothetical protein SAMN04487770_13841 [Butyrivibrio sp. ob235]|uniref:BREX-1 system phosphatase PglZ type B n=1 Tax=Butyrivibrio sp. ob235 TaxID=1761780 RepID=UPI0008D12D93|nr:BREX-1 system phosphatase PglZ type B [Butyrivibrio sp. ob235]SEM42715.1 hypothetical protein SAMN04487770_13841 [Butyrivibrio sp. ob235]
MADNDKRIIDILIRKIRQLSDYNDSAEVKPAVILWPDAERRFEYAIKVLQTEMNELFVLGDYNPPEKTGPAIWLRCAMTGTVPIEYPKDRVPVIYMPGVGREKFRPETSEPLLKPLIPLQYLGRFFSQRSSKDITPFSFLGNTSEGIGLDIPDGVEVRETLKLALPVILNMRLSELIDQHIDADYLNGIVAGGDTINSLLGYINSGDDIFQDDVQRLALKKLFKSRYGLDLDKDTQINAAEMLAKHCTLEWKSVWKQYEMAYDTYPKIEEQIRKCYYEPFIIPGKYAKSEEGWPQYNDQQETQLLYSLKNLADKSEEEIIAGIELLEKEHSLRIETLWGRHGQAQIARATAYLDKIVKAFEKRIQGSTINELAEYYRKCGYKADQNALLSLQSTQNDEQMTCIKNLLSGFYKNQIDHVTTAFQKAVEKEGYPYTGMDIRYKKNTCILFVDGLRYDMAKMLEEKLIASSDEYKVSEKEFWCPFPTVTACGKYAVSPIISELEGTICDDYGPVFKDTGIMINSTSFKKRLENKGWIIITDASVKEGDYGWCETRSIDKLGHDKQCSMAKQVDMLITEIYNKIVELCNAGWKYIEVVTDHGWLFIPNKMPKCTLPGSMTESNGGRCAKMAEGVPCEYQQVPWSWNSDVEVAAARGIGSFVDGKEYAHGGLSLQECLTLQLEVSRASVVETTEIKNVSWKGMACSFDVSGDVDSIIADIRVAPADSSSSLVDKKKQPDSDGHTRLIVTADDIEGKSAYIVLISNLDKKIINQKQIQIGDNHGT